MRGVMGGGHLVDEAGRQQAWRNGDKTNVDAWFMALRCTQTICRPSGGVVAAGGQ